MYIDESIWVMMKGVPEKSMNIWILWHDFVELEPDLWAWHKKFPTANEWEYWNEMKWMWINMHVNEKCEWIWIWKWYDMNMYLRMTRWKCQEMRNEMRHVLWNDNMICDCEMYEKKREMKCMKRNVIWNMWCEMNGNEECDCVMTTWDVIWLCNVWKEKRNKMYGNKGDMECIIVKQKEM